MGLIRMLAPFVVLIVLPVMASADGLNPLELKIASALCHKYANAYAIDPNQCMEMAKSVAIPEKIKLACRAAWTTKDESRIAECKSQLGL